LKETVLAELLLKGIIPEYIQKGLLFQVWSLIIELSRK
jgi:hypothetical protein